MTETVQEVVEQEPNTEPEPGTDPAPETDEPFEQPDAEPDETAQAAPAVGTTPQEYEAIHKKLDASADTWRRRVADLLGDDFTLLVPCELCSFELPGFHWPVEVAKPVNETHERLLRVLREPAAPEYQAATSSRQCGDCGGWGKVLSGSRLAQHETVACPTCKGYGYVPPPVPSQNGYAEAAQVTPLGVGLEEDESEPPADADIWGSPRLLPDGQENPNYGKMPQYKDRNLP